MDKMVLDIIGWAGAIGLLTGYLLFSLGKFNKMLWVYHIFNLSSSVLLLVNALYTHSGPFIFVNTVWSIIAVISIVKEWRKTREQNSTASPKK